MTRDDIKELVARGEGPTIEFTRPLTKDLGRELCAFANAGAGTVLVCVSDAGRVVGVADHERLKSRVLSAARSADPSIEVEVESVGEVLRVVVPPQKRKPYSFGGRFFMRDGASSRQMSDAEVEDLFYAAGRLHFDRKPCPDFSIESDLDDERSIRQVESEAGRRPESDREPGLESRGRRLESERQGPESTRPGPESLEQRVLALLLEEPLSRSAIAAALEHRSVSAGLNRVIHRLLHDGRIGYTFPDKPNSRLQKYRITQAGEAALEEPAK